MPLTTPQPVVTEHTVMGWTSRRARPRAGASHPPWDLRMGRHVGPFGRGDPDEPISTCPAGRIVAQRGLFAGPSLLVPEDLYARVERGAARRERHRVALGPATAVSTNTYFGRFHATYWQRWTAAPDVEVSSSRPARGGCG